MKGGREKSEQERGRQGGRDRERRGERPLWLPPLSRDPPSARRPNVRFMCMARHLDVQHVLLHGFERGFVNELAKELDAHVVRSDLRLVRETARGKARGHACARVDEALVEA
eukprot:2666088-Pleurochrysis_carterae.AAC.1